LTKYLKISLSFFGLMVNDGILDSQSNAAAYDQVSYAQAKGFQEL
jgi:hypothetical protein